MNNQVRYEVKIDGVLKYTFFTESLLNSKLQELRNKGILNYTVITKIINL